MTKMQLISDYRNIYSTSVLLSALEVKCKNV